MYSQKHKRMVEDLHFIFGLQPDLAKIFIEMMVTLPAKKVPKRDTVET